MVLGGKSVSLVSQHQIGVMIEALGFRTDNSIKDEENLQELQNYCARAMHEQKKLGIEFEILMFAKWAIRH